MAADSLAITYDDIRRAIGRLVGWGRDPDQWDAEEQEDCEDIIKAGLRRFYTPPVLPGERRSHDWSFLFPTATITTIAGDYDYDLPADFAMLQGTTLVYAPGADTLWPRIQVVGEHQIRTRLVTHTDGDATGRPRIAAVRVKEPDATKGTEWELLLWPVPNGEYDITYRYKINPFTVDSDALPFGGAPHAETILEACLAAAEERFLPDSQLHRGLFMERLIASVAHDRETNSPDSLGINFDRSDLEPDFTIDHHGCEGYIVRYNGLAYDD